MWFNEKKVFITGTDTEVGKTFISVKILNMFRQNGLKPAYFKPVATGGVFHDKHLISEDVLTVKKKTGLDHVSDEYMNPVIYEIPAAPLIASEIAGNPVPLVKIHSIYKKLNERHESLVVEGIGGIMVPLTQSYLVIDMIKEFKLPVIIASRAVLGTINHTALTVRILKDFGIRILGIMISYTTDIDQGIGVRSSFDVIQKMTGVPVIKEFPYEMDWK